MKQIAILLAVLAFGQVNSEEDFLQHGNTFKEFLHTLEPMMTELEELNQLTLEVSKHQQIHHMITRQFAAKLLRSSPKCLPPQTPLIQEWDLDACGNITETLRKATELGENIAKWVINATSSVGTLVFQAVNCITFDIFKTTECIENDFNQVKDLIISYKPIVLQFRDQIISLYNELKDDFSQCFKLNIVVQEQTKKFISEIDVCHNNMKNLIKSI